MQFSNFLKSELILGCILLVTFFLFAPVLTYEFVDYDDNIYITKNEHIQQLNKENLEAIFLKSHHGHYFPLTLLVHSVEYFFFGSKPFIYHLINLVLHLLNVLLLFFILKKFGLSEAISLALTAIYAVHPMHVESVVWLGARNNILSAFFYLSALLYYLQYRENESVKNYILAFVCLVLALLSKSSAITFLGVVFLVDFLQNRKINFKSILDKIPFLIVCLLFAAIAIKAAQSFGSIEDISFKYKNFDRPFLISYPIAIYFVKMFLPFDLRVRYHNPVIFDELLPQVYYISVLIIPVIIGLFFLHKNKKLALLLLGIFLLNVSLVLKIKYSTNVIAAERYAYLNYIGLIPFVFIPIYRFIQRFPKKIILGILGAYLVFLIAVSFNRMPVWKNSQNLFQSIVLQDPEEPKSYFFMAVQQLKAREYDGALSSINRALTIDSSFYLYHYVKGSVLFHQQNHTAAIQSLEKTLEIDSSMVKANYLMGLIYAENDSLDLAKNQFLIVLDLDPNNAEVHHLLGNIHISNEDYQKAIDYLEKAVELNPKDGEAWYNLGSCHHNIGAIEDACYCWFQANLNGIMPSQEKIVLYCAE